MRSGELFGTGKVFLFTLQQYLKSRSTIVAMVVMLAVSIASLGIAIGSMAGSVEDESPITVLSVEDRTASGITVQDIVDADPGLSGADIRLDGEAAGEASAAVTISMDESGFVLVEARGGQDSELTRQELSRAGTAVRQAAEQARLRTLGLDSDVLENLQSGPQVLSAEEYLAATSVEYEVDPEEADSSATSAEASYLVTYIWSILVMVLVSFSSSYIIRSVVEEKASRLAETLMVSVKPLSLLAGKVLASMCLVLIQMAVLAVGVVLSWRVAGSVFGWSAASMLLGSMGLDGGALSLNAAAAFVAVVTVLLAYLVFSLLGALSGVCCSTMEDVQSANGTVVMVCMLAYAVSAATSFLTDGTAAHVLSLIPVLSGFTVPARYILGQIGLGTVAASWALQAILIGLLALLSRNVYASMLLYRGERVPLRRIWSVARAGERGERA